MSLDKKYVISAVLVLVVAGAISISIFIRRLDSAPIPANILHKAAFSIFYPQAHVGGLMTKKTSITYSTSSNGLSYLVYVDSKPVYVSEQATPDIFSQNGVYAFKLVQARQYNDFYATAGEVTLTRPIELNNETVAWLNNKGTLLLARAIKSLSVQQWKLLFNNMIIVNP